MKIFFVSTIIIMLASFKAFSSDFSPTLLRLSADEQISYKFDGTNLEIPVKVSGTSACLVFCVFTKDQASSIGPLTNGYLGWHYVNNIDTCMYVSKPYDFDVGTNTVPWDGKDADGGGVPSGEYTYYMFAYDNVNSKKIACRHLSYAHCGNGFIQEYDENGEPLANPIFLNNPQEGRHATFDAPVESTRSKWKIGNDPEDSTLVETTTYYGYANIGDIAFQPDDFTKFFIQTSNVGTHYVRKYKWVPMGESEIQTDWGENGEFIFINGQGHHYSPGVTSDGNEYLFVASEDVDGNLMEESELIIIDVSNGTEVTRMDLSEYWISLEDFEGGGQLSGGPVNLSYRKGLIMASSPMGCMKNMINPYNEDELWVWVNENGDYIGDNNFEKDSDHPWVCIDFTTGPYMYDTTVDNNLFSACALYDLGAVSFALFAPDGTGIGNFAFAGEVAGVNRGHITVDNGSAYDGMYPHKVTEDEFTSGIWYIASDSIKGTITSKVGVDEAAPVAFAVAQNSPNPFNPATTINFSTVVAGYVSVDVFNIAGQKVDTLVNDFMSTGNHSVTWNASEFSAGVYFYTVKSGDFSKTMKMTLLK